MERCLDLDWEDIEFDWDIDHRPQAITQRLKVPGGWLVRSLVVNYQHEPFGGVGITFLPDPLYQWDPHR